jgi:hypothetical protein
MHPSLIRDFINILNILNIFYILDESINNDPDENQLKHIVYGEFGIDFPTNEIE